MAKRNFDYNTRPTGKDIQPFVDEFIKKNGGKEWLDINKYQRYRFYDSVIPRIKKFLKESKGLIRRQEMAELLGVSNDYLRAVGKTKPSKGGPNVRYKIFQDILGDYKKIYRPVSGANEGFYKSPTKSQIEAFKKNVRSSTILPVMQKRVNAFLNNKKFMNMLKKDALSDPTFLTKAQAMFPKLDLTSQKLAEGVLYIARGSKGDEFIGTSIKKNLPLHKRLINQFEQAPWGNPFHAAGYKFAQAEIDNQLGTKSGTFRGYQEALREAFKSAGFKNLKNYEVDEIVGTSIGGKQQVAPYSVFSRFLTEQVNMGPAAAYQGALSRASTKLTGIIDEFGPNSKQAINFVKDFNKNQASLFEKRHGIKAARLDLRMPEQVFGKKRFAELGTLGEQMTDVVKQKGFGFKLPTGALTQKELLKELANKNVNNVCRIFGGAKLASGGQGCGAQMAQALDSDPIGTANKIKDLKVEGGAINRIKNAATTFLKFAGKGKTFAITAGVGAGAGALVKQFRNDEPDTYLSDENQMKAMLVDTFEEDTLGKAGIGGELAAAGLAVPGSAAVYRARRLPFKDRAAMGPVRAALGPAGKALSGFATPLGMALTTPINIARQIREGDSLEDIATNPFNYLAPTFAGRFTREATRGMNPQGILAKGLRLGMSPAAVRGVSKFFGLPGLALSLGYEGYDQYKKYKEGEGFLYNLLNKDE
jgi:hypothetical protein